MCDEPLFNIGDEVVVVDNEWLAQFEEQYVGKRGIVREYDRSPFVYLPEINKSLVFYQEQLEKVK